MKATTIKLQGQLLENLQASKPEHQTLTAYVRSVLQGDLDRVKLKEAALVYRAFIESDESEKIDMDEWGRADLNVEPCESGAAL
ncbi:MAG: hypothetical protein L3J39_15005 [Verrucomicrobiales bacterium]|nr:hypothetical protein [Verrucomicrobiales bacterium]